MVHISPFGIHLALDGVGAVLFLLLMATLGAMSVGMLGRKRRFVVRAADLRANWHLGEIRMVDWWLMSRRCDVCHGMWPQEQCVRPPGPYEAQGIARESLEEIATARRDPVLSI